MQDLYWRFFCPHVLTKAAQTNERPSGNGQLCMKATVPHESDWDPHDSDGFARKRRFRTTATVPHDSDRVPHDSDRLCIESDRLRMKEKVKIIVK